MEVSQLSKSHSPWICEHKILHNVKTQLKLIECYGHKGHEQRDISFISAVNELKPQVHVE